MEGWCSVHALGTCIAITVTSSNQGMTVVEQGTNGEKCKLYWKEKCVNGNCRMLMVLFFWCPQYLPPITGQSLPRSFTCGNNLEGSMLASCSHTISYTSKSYTPASGTTSGAGSTAVIVGMWPFSVHVQLHVYVQVCTCVFKCVDEYSCSPDYNPVLFRNTCTLVQR